ncbi:hypothetical protein [Chromobacterium sp. CV08]|uniref:hypothetical protein n=1 Tax=Chromobacterium sp. CV08 TaxID=3133274 RepID=UPI003DA9D078
MVNLMFFAQLPQEVRDVIQPVLDDKGFDQNDFAFAFSHPRLGREQSQRIDIRVYRLSKDKAWELQVLHDAWGEMFAQALRDGFFD